MGTHPIFESDFDCLTDFFISMSEFQGKAPILEKLMSLPFQKVNHQITTIDSQPIIGVDDNKACCVMVTGQLKTDDDPPHSFHQTFILRPAGGSFVVANDFFRLPLHN